MPAALLEDPELAETIERLPGRPEVSGETAELVLGRRVSAAGRTSAFVQSRSASAAALHALGARLREGFEAAFRNVGLRGHVTGVGSLSFVHFGEERVRDARASVLAAAQAGPLTGLLHLGMIRRGVFSAPRNMYVTSTPMGEAEIDVAVAAFGEALRELRPLAEEQTPQLVAD